MPPLPPTVHLSTGGCILHGEAELDFALDGAFTLSWQRRYASHHAHCGVLGPGWTVPVSFARERGGEALIFIDLQGKAVARSFPLRDVGESFYSRYEHTTLRRSARERYELITPDGVRLLFAAHYRRGQHRHAAAAKRTGRQRGPFMQPVTKAALPVPTPLCAVPPPGY